jgi:hypothetical protein
MIARILGENKGTVKRHYKKYLEDPDGAPHPGRPAILPEAQHEGLITEVVQA